ncbi:hypothetical protein OIO90_002850 [Microbotryomycetes sp. JL221]|nr:hypothetical protein OIO90_002850 [Microbotryomycetes sp. JL221]
MTGDVEPRDAGAVHPSLSSPNYTAGSSNSCATTHSTIINTTGSRYLQDEFGRSILLHGVSLSGLNKLPTKPNGFTHLDTGFFDHEHVSFVGRPFPLNEADEHLSRLKQWGLTFIRLVVCWEALEHEGPGKYDHEYMQYIYDLVSMFPKYGLVCYIDSHQDVWSRHTGGSGAPTWTLEVVGFDIRNLKATGAAHAHNLHLEPHDPPPKVWPSGYTKLCAATMATLFWAGDTFAPYRTVSRTKHEGDWGQQQRANTTNHDKVGLQEFLQQAMIGAFEQLAIKLKDCEAVIGFEASSKVPLRYGKKVMNEPHRGYIDLMSPYGFNFNTDLAIGYFPTALQSWALGSGHPVLIDHYGPSFPAVTHQVLLTPPNGRSAWSESSGGCIWKQHGLWQWQPTKGQFGEPVSLRNEYFKKHPQTGKHVEWYRPNNLIFAPHWYDLQALFGKSLGHMSANVQGLSRGMFLLKALYFGPWGLRRNYKKQIQTIVEQTYRQMGELPIVLGETGVPFDLNNKQSFDTNGEGDYKWQTRMMDAICSALEQCLISYNLWHYNPLNEHTWGDSWNGEDFSIFSLSERTRSKLDKALGKQDKLNVGARALDAFERPYACKIAGIPLSTSFNRHSRSKRFKLCYVNPFSPLKFGVRLSQSQATVDSPPVVGFEPRSRETEIYLPTRVFGQATIGSRLKVTVSDGTWRYDEELQTLYVLHTNREPGFIHFVHVSVRQISDDVLQVLLGCLVVLLLGLVTMTSLFDVKMPQVSFDHWGQAEL